MVRIAITPILRSVVCCIGVQALTSYNWFGFIAALPQRFQINNLPSFWCLMPLIKSREAIHLIWSQIYAIWPTYEYTDMYMYHIWFFFLPKIIGCTSVHLYWVRPYSGWWTNWKGQSMLGNIFTLLCTRLPNQVVSVASISRVLV